MNDRILQALKALKTNQDKLQKNVGEIGKKVKQIEGYNEDRMRQLVARLSRDLERYEIIDGEWCYDGKPIGIKAEGVDGEVGPQGKDGKPGKDGKDGKPGKDGKNGLPGKDGKDGKDGKNGLPGKDGESPNLKIGKVEDSPEAGGAKAKIRKGKDGIYYLDLTLPRGPQGFPGFDGKDGKDAEGGSGVSDYKLLENKPSINGKKLLDNLSLKDLGIQPEGDYLTEEDLKGIDLTNYYTKEEIDNTLGDINTILATLVTVDEEEY